MATRKPKPPVPGCRVRLNRDVTTRGNVRFRAGVTMRLRHTEREYYLVVYVRGRYHALKLQKKDYPAYFTVVSYPPGETEDADANHPVQEGD